MSQNHRNLWIAWASFTALSLLAFFPALSGTFLADDISLFVANPRITQDQGLIQIWAGGEDIDYWPLSYTSFWSAYRLWGSNPFPYHLLNVLLQGLNGFLLYRILLRLLIPGAWLAAAIFVIHPLQVETVAWASELKNLQSGFFFFASIWFFLKHEENQKRSSYLGSLVCMVAAVLSKGSTVVLPGVLWLLQWWRRRPLDRPFYLKLLPYVLISAAGAAITIWFQKFRAGALGSEWELSIFDRFAIAGKNVWFYLAQTFWPARLSYDYSRWPLNHNAADLFPLLCLILLAGFLFAYLKSWGRSPLCALACFVVLLFPALGFFDIYFFRFSFVADRYQYLALAAPVCWLVASAASVLQKTSIPRWSFAAIVPCLGLLSFLSWQRSVDYRRPESLYTDTLRKNPESALAHAWMAHELAQRGQTDEALTHLRDAVRICPNYVLARNGLAKLLIQKGRSEEAEPILEETLRIEPRSAPAHLNYGRILLEAGHCKQAVLHLRQAMQGLGVSSELQFLLGRALEYDSQFEEAAHLYWAATNGEPNNPERYFALGRVLQKLGRWENARDQLEIGKEKAKAQSRQDLLPQFDSLLQLEKPNAKNH